MILLFRPTFSFAPLSIRKGPCSHLTFYRASSFGPLSQGLLLLLLLVALMRLLVLNLLFWKFVLPRHGKQGFRLGSVLSDCRVLCLGFILEWVNRGLGFRFPIMGLVREGGGRREEVPNFEPWWSMDPRSWGRLIIGQISFDRPGNNRRAGW